MGLPLVTLQEYKQHAEILGDTQNVALNSLIPKVSELVKTWCRRSFVDYVQDARTDVFQGGAYLNIRETPILAISSVEFSEDFGKTYLPLTEFVDYWLDQDIGAIKPTNANAYFKSFPNGYRVTYTCGYETLPIDLKLAIFDLITYYKRNDMALHANRTIGGNTVQIEYVQTAKFPAHIQRILDQYKQDYA